LATRASYARSLPDALPISSLTLHAPAHATVMRWIAPRWGDSALRHARHVRQAMGDALVAVDAGLLAGPQPQLVDLGRARALPGQVHRIEVVAVAALQRVVGLQPRPLVAGQHQPLVEELLAGIDGAENLAPDLLGGLHLARDLVGPVVRDMAVRAGGAHAGAVGVVDRGLQLLEH